MDDIGSTAAIEDMAPLNNPESHDPWVRTSRRTWCGCGRVVWWYTNTNTNTTRRLFVFIFKGVKEIRILLKYFGVLVVYVVGG